MLTKIDLGRSENARFGENETQNVIHHEKSLVITVIDLKVKDVFANLVDKLHTN